MVCGFSSSASFVPCFGKVALRTLALSSRIYPRFCPLVSITYNLGVYALLWAIETLSLLTWSWQNPVILLYLYVFIFSAEVFSLVLLLLLVIRYDPWRKYGVIINPLPVLIVGVFPLMSSFSFLEPVAHILPSSEWPLCFSYDYDALLFQPSIDTLSDGALKISSTMADDFCNIFKDELLY